MTQDKDIPSTIPGLTAVRISGLVYLLSPRQLQELRESKKRERSPRPSSTTAAPTAPDA